MVSLYYANWIRRMKNALTADEKVTYNLYELAFHFVLPALGSELFGTTENLFDGTRNHALGSIGLTNDV
jgi:hypothetical protein